MTSSSRSGVDNQGKALKQGPRLPMANQEVEESFFKVMDETSTQVGFLPYQSHQ